VPSSNKGIIVEDLCIKLYKTMYLIRKAEERIQEYYPNDEMKTPMHMSMGEEAIVAGVCCALSPDDQVLGTYRSHALYLAKTGETDRFFSEMYGKATGCARGKAGSMHLSAPEQGLLCCSAIVASSIPVALGTAFANKYKQNAKKVAVFFGDGALDAGVFWESLNFACLKKLPILFICEDNGFAVHTRRELRQGYASINEVVSKFNCNEFQEDTTDAEAIYNVSRDAIGVLEENDGPCFLRFSYYRYLEHVGINEDFDAGYRSRSGYSQWREKDPLTVQKSKLLLKGMSMEALAVMESEIDAKIMKSIELAKNAPFAKTCELQQGVYQCE